MAQIVINEVSQNYTFNIGNNSFATVALPITSCWGPALEDEAASGMSFEEQKDALMWKRFPATQSGLESFVSTYRGPATGYRSASDYSYQMAMTLITAGYDVLVCRVCPGAYAHNTVTFTNDATLNIYAKYAGSFGNNLRVVITKVTNRNYWNIITYVVDSSNTQTAVENLVCTFNAAEETDNIPYIKSVESKFITLVGSGLNNDVTVTSGDTQSTTIDVRLSGGTDYAADDTVSAAIESATTYAKSRYGACGYVVEGDTACEYILTLSKLDLGDDVSRANTIKYKEWLYTAAFEAYDMLQDKLNYNPQRIISPGWDDQDLVALDGRIAANITDVSPLHIKIMETAFYSRCACGLIDIPKSCARSYVYNDTADTTTSGYAQRLSRFEVPNASENPNVSLYSTHSALFAPWGSYQLVGMGKQVSVPPAFLALLIQRAMILNQSSQYEWALPTNRRHNLNIGTLDYKVSKKILDVWQKLDGVGVNVIADIPGLGTSLWGNSTLFDVPPATYQALANLSTRYLVNAVEDVAYKCGLAITFQYNNDQAYNKFYAGVTPTLDTMKNVGAIDDYYVRMAADIDGLDQVNANTVIGKIYLVINGVINDIIIDLIALPPGTDLNQFRA